MAYNEVNSGKPSTKGNDIFDTVELLEAILLLLPLKDVLLLQRVCKTWAATVKGSPQMQQALCFRSVLRSGPVPAAGFEIIDVERKGDWVANERPQAKKASETRAERDDVFRSSAQFLDYVERERAETDTRNDHRVRHSNPFLHRLAQSDEWMNTLDFSSCYWDWKRPNVYFFDMRRLMADSDDSSWQRMFLTQPPVKQIAIVSLEDTRDGFAYWHGALGVVEAENGVTVGDLVARLTDPEFESLLQSDLGHRICIVGWIS